MSIAELLAFANSLFAFGFGVLNLIEAKHCLKLKNKDFLWIKFLFGIMGMYWGIIYIFVIFADPLNYNNILFSQVFIRPANTFMFGILLASAIIGWRKPRGER